MDCYYLYNNFIMVFFNNIFNIMREPQLGVAVGKKGVGKTFTTTKIIENYVRGNLAAGIKPRKVLILDVNDEFTQIKAIATQDVPKFSINNFIEARRIRPFKIDGKKMSLDEITVTLSTILETFRGGLLLVEDINRYISDSMPNDLIGAICTNRHANMDIILHYQSIGRITPKVWQNLNWIRFHQNTESVQKHASKKFPDKEGIMSMAEFIVNEKVKKGDNRYFLYVDVDVMKIKGPNIDEVLKEEAIINFITMRSNYNQLIKQRVTREKLTADSSTKKPRSEKEIFEIVKKELMNDFF